MISSDLHETSRNLGKKKKSAWLHVYTPSSPKSYWPPTTSLEQFLRAIVLIYPQIKLTTLTLCFFFLKLTVPLGLGPLLTNFPLSWHNENTACKLVSQNPSVFGHRRQASTCIFQLMETRKYILIGHKAKLSKPRTKNKMKGKSLVFAQVTHSQICLSRCWSGDNRELTRLWGCLE